jgi:phospholipase C
MKTLFAFLLALASICVFAQSGPIQHVVIVVQENRTPDNLFGACPPPGSDVQASGSPIPLGTGYNPNHSHSAFLSNAAGKWPTKAIAYVQQSDIGPYCTLASEYGFSNRMFQTNQGPSTPAHQFLFSGTSAPSDTSDLFESEVAMGGCLGSMMIAQFIDPAGNENHVGSSCLNPSTLADLLDAGKVSWRYYAPSATFIWNSPAAIQHICVPVKRKCTGADWKNVDLNPPDVLTDIAKNALAQVSWVIPAASYSDHPASGSGGPAWVASIVNAVGETAYWQNTAILITWDDWGGWYDHVPPLPNGTGWCGSYCYGFRVPLVVVSAYTPAGLVDNGTHDFGSILRFVESTFGLGLIGPGTYADAYADNLSGFFSGSRRQFQPIKAPEFIQFSDRSDPDTD